MFRDIRRIKQKLSEEEILAIIQNNSYGILAVNGDDGYPYAVPLNYLYSNGKLYLHGAKNGHKIDAITKCPKVSFCIVDKDDIVPEEYTTYFKSVIIFGKARIINEPIEFRKSIEDFASHFAPNETNETRDMHIDKAFNNLCMIAIDIEHISGKQAIELVNTNKKDTL